MGRKQYERGISYDDERQLYYLYIDLGRDENGDRQRRYRTFRTLAEARKVQKDILAQKTRATLLVPSDLTLDQWLGRWMDEIVIPNRAETTAYGYQRIIQNHISPALGSIPLQKLSPRDLQHYYAELLRTTGLSANTVRRHHDLVRRPPRRTEAGSYPPLSHGAGGAAPGRAQGDPLLHLGHAQTPVRVG